MSSSTPSTTKKRPFQQQGQGSSKKPVPPPPTTLEKPVVASPAQHLKQLTPIEAEQQKRQRYLMTLAAIASNGAVRQVAQIMANGTRMSDHAHVQFTTHAGLIAKMLSVYELPDKQEAERRFFETLEQYLEQAVLCIPHAGKREDIPILIGLLKLLVHEHADQDGFTQVARYILRAATAPVDRF